MKLLNIYDIVDMEFIESSDSESGKSDFDDEYYYYKPPLLEDYWKKNIVIVRPNQFTADRENLSIKNDEIISKEDIFTAAEDSDKYEFRLNEFMYTVRNYICSMGLIKCMQSKSTESARKKEVHDSETDISSALFKATTSLQEEARKKNNNRKKVCETKEQQKKLFFVGLILLVILCVCVTFAFIHYQSF